MAKANQASNTNPTPAIPSGREEIPLRLDPHTDSAPPPPPPPPTPTPGEELVRQVQELSKRVDEAVAKLDAMDAPRRAREAEPFPCPRCQCTRTPVRNGTHPGVKGVSRYRACTGCGWTFSTIIRSEGACAGIEVLG